MSNYEVGAKAPISIRKRKVALTLPTLTPRESLQDKGRFSVSKVPSPAPNSIHSPPQKRPGHHRANTLSGGFPFRPAASLKLFPSTVLPALLHSPSEAHWALPKSNLSEVFVASQQGSIRGKPKRENQDSYAVLKGFMGERDSLFVMVCDGHGENGHLISRYITMNLPGKMNQFRLDLHRDAEDSLKEAFISEVMNLHCMVISRREVSAEYSGSTLVATVLRANSLLCANLGDSRAVLIYTDRGRWYPKQLTVDHKPDSPRERERIEANFGRVEPMKGLEGESLGPARVWLLSEEVPGLAMSRSIGDTVAHSVGVSETPEISVHCILPEDKAIVLASDGLWDAVTNEAATEVVSRHFMKGTMSACGKELVRLAEQQWRCKGESVDDITVAVVALAHQSGEFTRTVS